MCVPTEPTDGQRFLAARPTCTSPSPLSPLPSSQRAFGQKVVQKIEFELLPQRKMTPLPLRSAPLLLYGVASRADLRARGPPVRRGIRSHNIPIPHTHERCNSTRRKSRPAFAAFVRVPSVNLAERASEKTFFFISVLRFRKCMCGRGRQVHLAREIAVVRQKILFAPPTYVMHFIWQCNDTSHRGI